MTPYILILWVEIAINRDAVYFKRFYFNFFSVVLLTNLFEHSLARLLATYNQITSEE